MSDLASLQRQLRALIKRGPSAVETDDPYSRAVAESSGLAITREIVVWWRFYDVRRACPLTARLLERLGRFDEAVFAFARDRELSPFVEELAASFLQATAEDADPRVVALATFELALLRVKRGDDQVYVVDWDRDPFDPKMTPTTPPNSICYRTVISRDFPSLFVVQELELTP